ncbi:MAG TPA: UDP-N-acetylmuramate dehydrogenase [Elusimicrobiales bacterium]|nr:UDP-N-acetylmuramate dehydrogenase [Elusimicrobiales bacterium]HPO94902.1 UDP-N-acetylmuramate dehydrogenase [Elusimicrobiales bacterium]
MNSYELIKSRFQKRALTGVLAREITSYKTGGEIDLIVYPQTQEEIVWLFDILVKRNIDYFICGNATNILVSDDGFRGVFIKTDMLNKINTKDNEISVDCGFKWDNMIEICVNKGLAGLEKTSYIPGTVGGAVKMNAGAFEQETFDKLISFSVLDIKNGDVKKIEKSNINYGYRKVEGIEKCFIFNALFKFDYGDANELKKIREEIIIKRKIKQPLDYPSAGSVFKRPQNNYASKLIDECGLKGLRIGDAEVSTKHCGFIINKGNAKSSDIYNLILKIKEEVYKKTSIDLELEQIIVGKF